MVDTSINSPGAAICLSRMSACFSERDIMEAWELWKLQAVSTRHNQPTSHQYSYDIRHSSFPGRLWLILFSWSSSLPPSLFLSLPLHLHSPDGSISLYLKYKKRWWLSRNIMRAALYLLPVLATAVSAACCWSAGLLVCGWSGGIHINIISYLSCLQCKVYCLQYKVKSRAVIEQ